MTSQVSKGLVPTLNILIEEEAKMATDERGSDRINKPKNDII